jgi:hypothetical protein
MVISKPRDFKTIRELVKGVYCFSQSQPGSMFGRRYLHEIETNFNNFNGSVHPVASIFSAFQLAEYCPFFELSSISRSPH